MPQFVTIEQRITAGNDWNGAEPTTTPTFPGISGTNQPTGVKIYPTDTVGGLFLFDFNSVWLMEIQQIMVDFNSVGTKSIVIRQTGAPDILIFDSTDPLETNILITDRFQVTPDASLAIVSTSAANAMFARVIARPLLAVPASAYANSNFP